MVTYRTLKAVMVPVNFPSGQWRRSKVGIIFSIAGGILHQIRKCNSLCMITRNVTVGKIMNFESLLGRKVKGKLKLHKR